MPEPAPNPMSSAAGHIAPLAFLFPGQGAQVVGMAVDLVDAYPEARAVFDEGREVLGFDILSLCRNGPQEELNSTRVSQPAIFLHSMAVLEVLGRRLGHGRYSTQWPALGAAGLSLGEYSALVFVGSLEFEDALRLVALRGRFMQEACDSVRGAMASILGLAASRVEEVVQEAVRQGHRVGVANYNSPDQTVISGEVEGVEATIALLESAGAKRAVKLPVAGAYHSALMRTATAQLEPSLRAARVRAPRVPFFSNVTGREESDPEALRSNLVRQVESGVRWDSIVRGLVSRGMTRALEVGPGRVLMGLMRSISREVKVVSAGTAAQVEELDGALAQ